MEQTLLSIMVVLVGLILVSLWVILYQLVKQSKSGQDASAIGVLSFIASPDAA